MNWFLRDSLIVAAGTFAGAVAGTFCLLLELAGLWVAKGLTREDASSLERPRYRAAWLIVVGVWAILCGAYAIHVIYEVHWIEREVARIALIDQSEQDIRFLVFDLPVWILGLAVVVYQSFMIARKELNRFPAIFLAFHSIGMHVATFVVLIVVLSVVAHFAAGGIE